MVIQRTMCHLYISGFLRLFIYRQEKNSLNKSYVLTLFKWEFERVFLCSFCS